jgi:hypothetical protein
MGSQRTAVLGFAGSLADPDVRLLVRPGHTYSFEEFCALPGPAIGLDGSVEGPSRRSLAGPHASFNHHECVERSSTRATCEQVMLEVGQGLWGRMQRDGRPGADIHVNDADEDVCTSLWVLSHPDRIDEALVRRLVTLEGLIDVTGGCWWPRWAEDEDLLGELAWVFAPCHDARRQGRPAEERLLREIIDEVGERVTAHVDGRGGQRPADGHFEVLARQGPVAVVREHGPYARVAARRAGLDTVICERWAGPVRVVNIAKTSPWAGTDLVSVFQVLNEIEGCSPEDCWGGSDLVGGSPRRSGTSLPLDLVLATVARQ